MKKHFTDEGLFDFVRQLLPQSESKLMQDHLAECEKCNKLYNIWKAVAKVTSRERHYQPAEPSIRIAKAAYATRRRQSLIPMLAKMIPLVFDSFRDERPAVVRAGQIHAPARLLLHRTRSLAVDLRLEVEGGKRMSIIGQVLRSGQKSPPPAVADVFLIRGDTLLAQTSTNQFGEFQLQCQRQEGLNIYLDISGRPPLGIALPDPDA